jgi:ABC-type glutathione transport system ATPase component
MTNNALVKLRDVTQKYKTGKKEFVAVSSVNLTVSDGEYVALVGSVGLRQEHAPQDNNRTAEAE